MAYEDVDINKLKISVHKIVESRMRSAMRMAIIDIDRLLERMFQCVPRRELKLQFNNKISQTILTGEEIKGEEDTSIEVILIDTCTGNVVEVGPEASASVEIVVLKGDEFDACEGDNWFNDNIVQVELGKLPLLAGNIRVKLERGKGVVNGIKFRNHTVKMNQNMFRLGARFVDSFKGIQVKEAKTEVFPVKDFRNKYNRKHDVPSLTDEVWRLQNIQRGGKIDERLRRVQVFTVEDFLTQLLMNPAELKETVKLGPKKWEATLNHARTCSIDQRRYCYINFDKKTGVVFDRLGNVLGLILKGRYASTNILSREDKIHIEELVSSAIENWKDTLSFDNEVELQHYLSLFTFANPPSSFQPEHSTRLQPGPSKMTGKDGCVQSKSFGPVPGVETAHKHPLDSFGPDNTGQLDKPGPSSSQWDKAQPREEVVCNDDMEIEQGNPTNSVASVDQVGPTCGVSTDEFFYEGLEELVSDVGGNYPNGFSYMPSVEYPLQNATVLAPDFDPYHTQLFDNNSEF